MKFKFKRKSRKSTAQRAPYKPTLEELESRMVPATFTWIGSVNGSTNWLTAPNWRAGAGAPAGATPGSGGRTNDVVTMALTSNVILPSGNNIQIASLTMSGVNAGQLTLDSTLTINAGGSMSGGTIVQGLGKSIGPALVFRGGNFVWTGGNINFDPTGDTNTIRSAINVGGNPNGGATFTVQFGAPILDNGNLGSTLNVLPSGSLVLDNRAPLTLRNNSSISNSGIISITGDGAVMVPQDARPITINNFGSIFRTRGLGQYLINAALRNLGSIRVESGILSIAGTSKNGYSIENTSGTIALGGSKLIAVSGFLQEGNSRFTFTIPVANAVNNLAWLAKVGFGVIQGTFGQRHNSRGRLPAGRDWNGLKRR